MTGQSDGQTDGSCEKDEAPGDDPTETDHPTGAAQAAENDDIDTDS